MHFSPRTTLSLFLLTTVITTSKSTSSKSKAADTECQKTVKELENRLDRVRKEVDGLNRDKLKLEIEIKLLTNGILEEEQARQSAVKAMNDLFEEIMVLKEELARKNEETCSMNKCEPCLQM
ncbi:uncharacterized protein [Littorina saxatilis]|uniref:uncharacterized protein n=1 Tax=Littorina saxatilis TaxID=31220 RepID=UPI0038B47002